MSLILIKTLFYKASLLEGEIWCWSLLGEGLTVKWKKKKKRSGTAFFKSKKVVKLAEKFWSHSQSHNKPVTRFQTALVQFYFG